MATINHKKRATREIEKTDGPAARLSTTHTITEHTSTEHDPRWPAVVNRDRSFDGRFFFSVQTTGVYCRPGCPARTPKPTNVRFHESCDDAERAGFRPCKRCNPRGAAPAQAQAKLIGEICREIEAAADMPRLDDLARRAGLSPYHFHRVFKEVTGLTPRSYAAAHRAKRVREELAQGVPSVTGVFYDAGFHSSGRFYETSNEVLGMTPTRYRSGGADATIRFAVGECSLGSILVAQSQKGICAILIGDDPDALTRDLQDRFPRADIVGGDADFEKVVAHVVGFVEAPQKGLDLPLDIRGTAFQQRVWEALRTIPAGSTASYSQIAERIGSPKAVRAVGGACAANPIAIAIPCHRVIRQNEALSGYRWGTQRKQKLIERERLDQEGRGEGRAT